MHARVGTRVLELTWSQFVGGGDDVVAKSKSGMACRTFSVPNDGDQRRGAGEAAEGMWCHVESHE